MPDRLNIFHPNTPSDRCDRCGCHPIQGHKPVAVLSVPEGSTAYLGHPEHGYMGIAPGDYTISRQREMADQIRRVAD